MSAQQWDKWILKTFQVAPNSFLTWLKERLRRDLKYPNVGGRDNGPGFSMQEEESRASYIHGTIEDRCSPSPPGPDGLSQQDVRYGGRGKGGGGGWSIVGGLLWAGATLHQMHEHLHERQRGCNC